MLTDEQIIRAIQEYKFDEIITDLAESVANGDATFVGYTAFTEAVSQLFYTQYYPLAFESFVKANLCDKKDTKLLQRLYMQIEPVITGLGFAYFDDKNSKNINRD